MSVSPWLDTIAAIASPIGEGAVSLLRLSGPQSVVMAAGLFRGRRPVLEMTPRQQHYGTIFDGEQKIDDVLLTLFRAPASYTGEDVVEIAAHGGLLVTRRLLDLLVQAGARLAGPGEFTQRAFLHGKMDLTQAEAVMDLISAQTDLSLRAAHEQLSGQLGRRVVALEEQLLEVLAHTEAYIDFPDEDIAPDTGEAMRQRVVALEEEIELLLSTAQRGRIIREGLRTVIYGAPNVGKSSLLNLLLGYDRAIVSSTPGTTRDSIEEVINLRGVPLRLVDTAGVRASEDALEQAGIQRTQQELTRADLVLRLYDASEPPPAPEALSPQTLIVLNKIDLGEHPAWTSTIAVRLSCATSEGVPQLEEAIEHHVFQGKAVQRDWSVAINARHQAHLQQARAYLQAACAAMTSDISAEFIAEELRAALHALGEIIGRRGTEDLLGKIFSTFCIGK